MILSFVKSYDSSPSGMETTIFEFELSKKTSMPLSDKILRSVITSIQQNRPDHIPNVPAYLVVAQKHHGQTKFSTIEAFFILESQDQIMDENPRTHTPIPEAIELHRILGEYDCKKEILIWMVNAMVEIGTNPFWVKRFPIGNSEE